jgi:hypothetical protein
MVWNKLRSMELRGDMLPSSLIDANVSLKWKQRKSKELGHAL